MPKVAYKEIRFKRVTLELLNIIDAITTEYMRRGFPLTVRQLYYQLVARGHIENNKNSYSNVVSVVNDGRMTGFIDWDAIEDRTRYTRSNSHWETPRSIIGAVVDQYAEDKRETQPIYIECWIEKDALINVLERTASKLDVPCFSCRGYPSVSAMRDAAARFRNEAHREGRVILYAGDHDPSGVDIPRDISEKMEIFGANVEVKRIALTDEQIEQYKPPPNYAKETDKRFKGYVKKHGELCWELDALDPEILSNLFEDNITELTDFATYQSAKNAEARSRRNLATIYREYENIAQTLF